MSTGLSSSAIAELAPLIGTWRMDVAFPDARQGPPEDTGARTVFEYGPGSAFVVQRWHVPHPAAPDGIAIITADPARGGFLQHYFDARGVVRVYEMTFAERTWTLQRTRPDFSPLEFSQRWEATLSSDNEMIEGRWLHRSDNGQWSHDFELTYTKLAQG